MRRNKIAPRALRKIKTSVIPNVAISATSVRFDYVTMWVELTEQRDQAEISRLGLHWETLDEDISIAGLIAGRSDVTRHSESAA